MTTDELLHRVQMSCEMLHSCGNQDAASALARCLEAFRAVPSVSTATALRVCGFRLHLQARAQMNANGRGAVSDTAAFAAYSAAKRWCEGGGTVASRGNSD